MSKPSKQKLPYSNSLAAQYNSNDTISDPRFSNIQTDPRFRLPSRRNTHVKVDKRFAHMLSDESFQSKAKVDRYGRKIAGGKKGRGGLERLYQVEGDEEEEEEDDDEEAGRELDEEVERELSRVEELEKKKKAYDPARDGGFSDSSSSDEDEEETSSEEGDSEVEDKEVFGFPDQQNGEGDVPKGEVSRRIAVVNLDWDNIRAADLMAVFSSFAPSGGRIIKVEVFPSEFGKERMEREEIEGPPKEIFAKNIGDVVNGTRELTSEDEEEGDEGEDEDEDERIKKSILKEDQGEEFDSAKLRRYQLERLRYFYAVLTCSSSSVAEAIYNAVDGTEYLTTANFFDLRFIPDEMDFSEDKPRDVCERIPDGYKPNDFVTDALQHSKVKLTWDADDATRKDVQRRAFSGSRADILEEDLKIYLGSDSSDDDETLEVPDPILVDSALGETTLSVEKPKPKPSKKDAERQKMRALLGLSAEPTSTKSSRDVHSAPVGDMEITFSSGLSNPTKNSSVFENTDETTVEKYVRKEKERKARRKEKMKATRNGTAGDAAESLASPDPDLQLTNDANVDKDLGFDDPFFTAPTHDKANTSVLRKEQKRKKRAERLAEEAAGDEQRKELELLMLDDEAPGGKDVHHFDINTLAKAEKVERRKKKGKGVKLSVREKEALEAKASDSFQIDVKDPRFAAVFERSEYAVDPGHPRFKGTEGMRALVDEGRRKRGREGDRDLGREKKKTTKSGEGRGGEEDLKNLVERVKGKSKVRSY